MADNDAFQQALQLQSLVNSSRSGGGGKPGLLFGVLPDLNAGSLSTQGWASKNIFEFRGKPGMGSKFLEAIQRIPEDMRKMAQEAGVMYSGDMPSGNIFDCQGAPGIQAPDLGGNPFGRGGGGYEL